MKGVEKFEMEQEIGGGGGGRSGGGSGRFE